MTNFEQFKQDYEEATRADIFGVVAVYVSQLKLVAEACEKINVDEDLPVAREQRKLSFSPMTVLLRNEDSPFFPDHPESYEEQTAAAKKAGFSGPVASRAWSELHDNSSTHHSSNKLPGAKRLYFKGRDARSAALTIDDPDKLLEQARYETGEFKGKVMRAIVPMLIDVSLVRDEDTEKIQANIDNWGQEEAL